MAKLKSFFNFFVIFTLLMMSGCFQFLLLGSDFFEGFGAVDSDASNYAAYANIPFLLFSSLFVFFKWNWLLETMHKFRWLYLLSFYFVLTSFWSYEPIVSMVRSLMLLSTMFFSLTLYYYYDRDEFLILISKVYLIMSFVVFFAVLFTPSMAIHQDVHFPALRGWFSHKNIIGRVFVVGLLFSLACFYTVRKNNYISIITSFLCAFIVVLSLSGTSLFSIFLASCLALFLWITRSHNGFSLTGLIVVFFVLPAFVIIVFSSGFYIPLIEYFGKDATLTGRTIIWDVVFQDVLTDKWFLGYGYQAFWISELGTHSTDWDLGFYVPPHAHNAYVHTLVDGGVVGLLFFIIFIFSFIIKSINDYIFKRDFYSIFIISILLVFIFINFAEVEFLKYGGLSWSLIMTLYCYISLPKGGYR